MFICSTNSNNIRIPIFVTSNEFIKYLIIHMILCNNM